ncbi:serendipity locus protein alpha [Cydia pomonella]|uniref:serendipity locus protein alpha n=1 Tax=Cydia pomonella TaxID=82600 RepID=UPI002ADE2593|nr:serendipity locus protein alpha [Cydia pomonella]
MDLNLDFLHIPRDPPNASKFIVDLLFNKIYPLIIRIRTRLQADIEQDEEGTHILNVFTLCCSQIKKCVLNLFDIFKLENQEGILLQESRQCTIERLSWCVNRLVVVEDKLKDLAQNTQNDLSCEDSPFTTPIYFVNWMDHTFETLSKLAEIIYKTDYKDSVELYFEWKIELLDCMRQLHSALDELLLSAMTLCKYCLPSDQIIVKTRCQVVLREAKVLINEVIEGDTDGKFNATVNSLKLPIMPTNVNVTIDVLKDVLYVLETNTNTALLALVVHCFSNTVSPVDILKGHFENTEGCPCHDTSEDNIVEDCEYVKDFDLYSERLLQIGSFAVSCSSDQERIVSLRSGLASLEALDPHLVPALMVSPGSCHAGFLSDSWRKEVQDIKDSVFLIVDPAAFAEKSKQMMHQTLLQLFNTKKYESSVVCSVINLGGVVRDFFDVYIEHEPDALSCQEALLLLLADLNKALQECKVVSNLLCSKDDYSYDIKKPTHKKEVSLEQLFKRLKLLYTLVNRINQLLHPDDNDDQFFKSEIAEEQPTIQNATYTMNPVIGNTYVSSPKNIPSMTRSVLAKTANIRTPAMRFPLKKLIHQIKAQKCNELNFSVQLDAMFNLSEFENDKKEKAEVHKSSILYNFSPKKNRSSLRKMVLNKCYNLCSEKQLENKGLKSEVLFKESLMDDTTSLQISEILEQMHDMTKLLSKTNSRVNRTWSISTRNTNRNTSLSKYLCNIPPNDSTLEVEVRLDDTEANATNATVPSDVSTLERLKDLNRIENKLTNLKLLHRETRL